MVFQVLRVKLRGARADHDSLYECSFLGHFLNGIDLVEHIRIRNAPHRLALDGRVVVLALRTAAVLLLPTEPPASKFFLARNNCFLAALGTLTPALPPAVLCLPGIAGTFPRAHYPFATPQLAQITDVKERLATVLLSRPVRILHHGRKRRLETEVVTQLLGAGFKQHLFRARTRYHAVILTLYQNLVSKVQDLLPSLQRHLHAHYRHEVARPDRYFLRFGWHYFHRLRFHYCEYLSNLRSNCSIQATPSERSRPISRITDLGCAAWHTSEQEYIVSPRFQSSTRSAWAVMCSRHLRSPHSSHIAQASPPQLAQRKQASQKCR